jgi:hypothetical protein
MTLPIRYSPSGTVIADIGAGFRIRCVEELSTMGGSSAIPTIASTICTDGFGGADPVLLELDNPKAANQYRAELRCDLFNTTSGTENVIALSIQTSVDEGDTWTTRVLNAHVVQPQLGVGTEDNGQAREASVTMVLVSGADLGIVDGTTEKLQVRAQARSQGSGTLISSSATVGVFEDTAGTIHLLLEECI